MAWISFEEAGAPDEAIEFGHYTQWQDRYGYHVPTYYYYLVWHHGDEKREYFVYSLADTHLSDVQMRAIPVPDGGIWLVLDNKEVIASLDRQTGRFINRYGSVVDYRTPRSQQEKQRQGPDDPSKHYEQPKWATPTNGVLIAHPPS